jgi:hypothetical protein
MLFQFFPSCCHGLGERRSAEGVHLSILSQLLPEEVKRDIKWIESVGVESFNSFPVAAANRLGVRGPVLDRESFNSFPVAARRKAMFLPVVNAVPFNSFPVAAALPIDRVAKLPVAAWRSGGLSILSQLLHAASKIQGVSTASRDLSILSQLLPSL